MTNENENPLLSKLAFAQSLSAPRAPPLDSIQRALYVHHGDKLDLSSMPIATHWSKTLSPREQSVVRRILLYQRQQNYRTNDKHREKKKRRSNHQEWHPHMWPNLAGQEWTRYLFSKIPTSSLNHIRSSGLFHQITDSIVTFSVPTLAIASPGAAARFVSLTSEMQQISYGSHDRQFMDVFSPTTGTPRGLLFFVHGGAWGSTAPWMYRLVVAPFLQIGMAAVVVGYRIYPFVAIPGQVADLELAAYTLSKRFPQLCFGTELGTFVIGHSSGAHTSLLMMIRRARRKLEGGTIPMDPTGHIGISGPYNISHHFDYEAARGVEELSPMKAAAGFTRQNFDMNSPAHQAVDWIKTIDESKADLNACLPKILLVHGMDDMTVPFTSTAEACRVLRSCGITRCNDMYLPGTGHEETVMQLMLGGICRDKVLEWIQSKGEATSTALPASSRL